MYVGIDNVSHSVQKAYVGIDGVAKLWFQNTVAIETLPVGSIVKAKYGDGVVELIIVNQGNPNTSKYDGSCDGTWLLSRYCVTTGRWSSKNVRDFKTSEILSWMNSTFYNTLNDAAQSSVKDVIIPYYISGGFSSISVMKLSTKMFLLAAVELGFNNDSSPQKYLNDGSKLAYFNSSNGADEKRVGYLNGSATEWWLRTPRYYTSTSGQAVKPQTDGSYGRGWVSETWGIRPAFIVKSETLVDGNGYIV